MYNNSNLRTEVKRQNTHDVKKKRKCVATPHLTFLSLFKVSINAELLNLHECKTASFRFDLPEKYLYRTCSAVCAVIRQGNALGETSSSYAVVNAVSFGDTKYKNLTISFHPLNSVQFRD